MFIFVVVWSYLYVNNSDVPVIPRNTNSDSKLDTNTISDLDTNISLQKKIVETESELDNLYDTLNREINITF